MKLPPGYAEDDIDKRVDELREGVDQLLDMLWLGLFNLAYHLDSKLLFRLSAKVPFGEDVIGR